MRVTVTCSVITSPISFQMVMGFSVPSCAISAAFFASWRFCSCSKTWKRRLSRNLFRDCGVFDRRGAGDAAAENAGDERIRAEPIGAVILVFAFAGGVNSRDVGRLIFVSPTCRPSCNAWPGKLSWVRRADRRREIFRRFRGCLRACGRAFRAECA